MTSFRFLHAADIHLDSPLYGLSRYEGLPVEDIRLASRAAFDNLVQFAIDEAVDFLVIAGDLFDGDWRDMGTGLYFARAMGRLDQAGIPAFILAGNHDASSILSRSIPWPANVRNFASRAPQSHLLPELGVALHGQSFASPAVTDNLVQYYPAPQPHAFNIGVLHTALTGRPGHHAYAPCSLEDLNARGYDYWALGHVHEFEVVATNPHVVFSGNIQGRTIRETGVKGAVLVTVTDGEVSSLEQVPLDVIRWVRVKIDCTNAAAEAVVDLVRTGLANTHGAHGGGHPLVARVSLVGAMAQAGALHDRAALLRDEVRALAAAISADLHIEKVKVEVEQLATKSEAVLGDELGALIASGASDPALIAAVEADLERFLVASGTVLDERSDGELRLLAASAKWPELIGRTSLALGARLSGEG